MASRNRGQRIAIWIIAIVMTVGTIGSFAVIILANDNSKIDQAREESEQQKQYEEYVKQQKILAQENADNSEPLDGYSTRQFDASKVTKLNVEVLKQGSGEALDAKDTITVSYFGWLSTGSIFDSTNKKDADNLPVSFALNEVIPGWTEGLTGVRVGSVVRLTIPADKAYGPSGSGVIPADAPLEFIVEVDSVVAQG